MQSPESDPIFLTSLYGKTLFFLLAQEDVVGHPAGWLGVGAVGFLLGVPETLATLYERNQVNQEPTRNQEVLNFF